MKYRKKPVVIDAVQFTKELRDAVVLGEATCPSGLIQASASWHQADRKVWNARFYIKTLEGDMAVELNDWIITGVKGERYPCKPDIFEQTYIVVQE